MPGNGLEKTEFLIKQHEKSLSSHHNFRLQILTKKSQICQADFYKILLHDYYNFLFFFFSM